MNPKISQRLFENTMSYLRLACFPSDAELAPRGCSDPLDMNGFSQAMLFVMLTAKGEAVNRSAQGKRTAQSRVRRSRQGPATRRWAWPVISECLDRLEQQPALRLFVAKRGQKQNNAEPSSHRLLAQFHVRSDKTTPELERCPPSEK
jgi:hypothetical protein